MGNKVKPSRAAAEGARCRWHPRHRQGAGVCAFCVRERLSRLSLSAASLLPSVVRGEEEGSSSSSSCSEASTAAYSSEGSSGCSSAASASSGRASRPGSFHDETRRAGRVSLLMRHERVVGDADAVAAFLRARREQRRTSATSSFWAKLLQAARGGGAKQGQDDGCSLTQSKTTLQERVAAAKWVLF